MFTRIDARQIFGVFGGTHATASLFVSGESFPSAQTAPALTTALASTANHKCNAWPSYGMAKNGHIALQDHGNPVASKNIKIRVLN